MRLQSVDWIIIAGFMLVSLGIGVYVSRRASKDSVSFFLSNRQMPWWLLGVSMVATTFSTDTPNLVTEIVRTDGVSGNWIWWAFLLTGMVTAFLYARLWRRAGVLTDLEFYELRYSGKAAVAVRAFRSIYLGVFFNAVVMALVTLAAIKIGAVILGLTPLKTVLVVGSVTVVFTTFGGFLGVVITDLLLFAASMIGAIATAWVAVNLPEVGGLSALFDHPIVAEHMSILPDFSNWEVALTVFIIPLAVQWWSVWYPGPNREAAAMWRSACWQRKMRTMLSPQWSCSRLRTTRCGRGHGYWWRWLHWSSFRTSLLSRALSRRLTRLLCDTILPTRPC